MEKTKKRKLRVKSLVLTDFDIKIISPKSVLIDSVVFDRNFNILVKKNQTLNKNDAIMVDESGQKIVSPFCAKCKNISLIEDVDKNLGFHIELERICENLEKNESQNLNLVFDNDFCKTKKELIDFCKNNGVVFGNFFIEDFFDNCKNILNISLQDDQFVFNNFMVAKKFENEICFAISLLQKLCCFDKIRVFANKKNRKIFSENFVPKIEQNLCEKNAQNLQKNDEKNAKKCKNIIKFCHKKPQKFCLNLFDLFKIYCAYHKKNIVENLVSITGGALQKNVVILAPVGIKICDIVSDFGGFKNDIGEVEDYKYMSLVATSDLGQLKQKIKLAKNEFDKKKLEKMLQEKKLEAQKNVFSKFDEYKEKFYQCLSACFLTYFDKKRKVVTKNLNLPLNYSCQGVHLLNFKEFH